MDVRKLSVSLGDEQIELLSTPGLPEWEDLSPSINLLVKYSKLQSAENILLMGCDLGSLCVYLRRFFPAVSLAVHDLNATALEICRRTLSANGISQTSVNILESAELPTTLEDTQDVVFLIAPKGRVLSRRWLVQAMHALKLGGRLFLVGANSAGIRSIIKDAGQLFGGGSLLAYKKGHRVAEFTRPSTTRPLPDWASFPGIAPHTWVEFPVTVFDQELTIRSLPGVFSYDHLDEGTALLLAHMQVPAGTRVVDIGCGYGIIGLSATIHGASLVHLVDNNLLAVASTRASLAVNHMPTAEVFCGDLLDPLSQYVYDLILSNPPFHRGHAVDYQIAEAMIRQSFHALHPGGRLVIVANRFIRYQRLIQDIFANVSILAESPKFHLLSGIKSS
jgi:16S rRNA (guanine1207-N2)-methyltransferase